MAYDGFTTPSGLLVLIDTIPSGPNAGRSAQLGKLLEGTEDVDRPLDKQFSTAWAVGHSGVPEGKVLKAKPATLDAGLAEGDYHPGTVDKVGNQWVRVGPLKKADNMSLQTGIGTTSTQITVDGGIPAEAVTMVVQGYGSTWRYTDTAQAASPTFGFRCEDGEKVMIDTDPLSDFRVCAESGTIDLMVAYYL